MKARLYANENFPWPVVERLCAFGNDVITIQETGQADQSVPDDQVLAFAVNENRSVITLNRQHFIRLHRERPNHMGIFVCKVDANVHALADRIHHAFTETDSLKGKLLRINRGQKL